MNQWRKVTQNIIKSFSHRDKCTIKLIKSFVKYMLKSNRFALLENNFFIK